MVREDLISSAIAFLQDPSVAVSPIDKRKAFLQSKNLTEEEIVIALARAGEDQTYSTTSAQINTPSYAYSNPQSVRQPPPPSYGYGYGPYQGGPWPPEPPRRDWRDWFIMATVTGGVSYGLYTVAKRYVMPLISPPTPPQLEQDKASIDASFSRAFTLIDQLATDTATLKTAEAERTEKLDSALQEVGAVLNEIKAANKKREDDSRRLGDEVRGLKEMIPKALEGWKTEEDVKLKELGTGLKSLKILVGNRMGADQGTTNVPGRSHGHVDRMGGSGTPTSRDQPNHAPSHPPYAGVGAPANNDADETQEDTPPGTASSMVPAPAPGVNIPKLDVSSPFKFEARPGGRAAIPAWQMAAAASSKGKPTKIPEPAKVDGSAEGSEASVDA
ncbi:peroxisomal membrane protein pex14 [Lambiella insularis]|nr:peroxisomal membrane protein pex14 [Lambiella insularis]